MRKSVPGCAALTAAAAVGAGAAYAYAVRPRHLRWGATDEELRARLPGDELVSRPDSEATHAVTIEAPADEVWPWIAQIGQDRGGFYSYTWLENLVGCRMRNAGRIIPEFQQIKVGDAVRLHPKVPPLPVLVCDPPHTLVLGSNTGEPGTWGFYLTEVDEDTTRLVVRGRGELKPGLFSLLFNRAVFEPAHFVMERKMLLGIKRRAESLRQCLGRGGRRHVRAAGEQW
jgi:hypothetical protein